MNQHKDLVIRVHLLSQLYFESESDVFSILIANITIYCFHIGRDFLILRDFLDVIIFLHYDLKLDRVGMYIGLGREI